MERAINTVPELQTARRSIGPGQILPARDDDPGRGPCSHGPCGHAALARDGLPDCAASGSGPPWRGRVRDRCRTWPRARLQNGRAPSWHHAIGLRQQDLDAVRRDGPQFQRPVNFQHCACLRDQEHEPFLQALSCALRRDATCLQNGTCAKPGSTDWKCFDRPDAAAAMMTRSPDAWALRQFASSLSA